jgi:hypothetical protein
VIALLLFLAGVLNDPPWKWYSPSARVVYLSEADKVARSLYHSGAFANPFGAMPTGPTAHVAPAYPFLQSLLLRLWGEGGAGWLALRVLPTVALSLQFALLPYAARIFGYPAWVGVLASVFGLISKPAKEEHWEAHLAGLAILLLAVSMRRWIEWPDLRLGLTTGVIAGFAILLQPVIALIYLVWLAHVARTAGLLNKKVWALWLAPLLLCSPWMIRNQRVLGFAGIRDNLGIELFVSFNDCAPFGVRESEEQNCFMGLHPNTILEEATKVREMGEYRYNQNRFRTAVSWMADHPARAAALVGERLWFFWFPSDDGWTAYAVQRKRMLAAHAITVLSMLGLFLSLKDRVRGASLLTLWAVLYPAAYYVVQFEVRYRYPILWITWLTAAYAVFWVWRPKGIDKMGRTAV